MTKDIDQKTGLGKVCTKCGEWKLLEEFAKEKTAKDGRRAACKECRNKDSAAWRRNNPDKMIAAKKSWLMKHAEEVKAYRREYRKSKAEEIRVKNAEWLARNPDYFVNYRKENADRRRAYNAEWVARNPEKVKEKQRQNHKNNRTSPSARLAINTRARVWKSLRGATKNGRRTFEILGYTKEELIAHLEKNFTDGMTWDNYGEWHIDHIIPISAFNFETPDDIDFKRAWELSNLQPLWRKDNQQKGAKLFSEFQPSLAISIPPTNSDADLTKL